jgi:hypothetical protein
MSYLQPIFGTHSHIAVWVRENVLDAAPLWTELYRVAIANVRMNERPR